MKFQIYFLAISFQLYTDIYSKHLHFGGTGHTVFTIVFCDIPYVNLLAVQSVSQCPELNLQGHWHWKAKSNNDGDKDKCKTNLVHLALSWHPGTILHHSSCIILAFMTPYLSPTKQNMPSYKYSNILY